MLDVAGAADVGTVALSSVEFKTLTATCSCVILLAAVATVVFWRRRLHIRLYFKERLRTAPRDDGLSDSRLTLRHSPVSCMVKKCTRLIFFAVVDRRYLTVSVQLHVGCFSLIFTSHRFTRRDKTVECRRVGVLGVHRILDGLRLLPHRQKIWSFDQINMIRQFESRQAYRLDRHDVSWAGHNLTRFQL